MGWCLQQTKIRWLEKKRKKEAPARNGDTSHIRIDGEEPWALEESSRQVGLSLRSDYASSLTALHLANPRHSPKLSLNTPEDMGARLLEGSTNGGNFASVTRSRLLMTWVKRYPSMDLIFSGSEWMTIGSCFSTTRSTATSNYTLLFHQSCSGNASIFSRKLLTLRESSHCCKFCDWPSLVKLPSLLLGNPLSMVNVLTLLELVFSFSLLNRLPNFFLEI